MMRAAIVVVVVAACATDAAAPLPAPTVSIVSVAANETNVLAALVSVASSDADSVRVVYHVTGEPGDSAAPATISSAAMQLPVYGLQAERTYAFRVIAFGPGGATTSDSVMLTTGALPGDLPSYTTSGTPSTPGFVVFSAGKYGLVIDHAGRVVWYHAFPPNGPGLNFIAQSNGRYAAQPPPLNGAIPAWQEVDPSGERTRTFGCADGLTPRFHDLIRDDDDSYWIICDEIRMLDLSHLGGKPVATVTAAQIQHRDANGTVRFRWSAFEHLDISDLDPAARAGTTVNWTHANALARHPDGSLLVSFRNLSEIVAINTNTGAIAWRLGGPRDEFGIAGCCAPAFARQHGVRATSAGSVIFLDNLGEPGNSRVTRYTLDVALRQARLDGAFSAAPPVVANLGGSVQELPNGNILAAFGDGRRVEEHDPAGNVVWRIDGDPGYVFRAQRIRSLYAPGAGTTR